MEINGKNIIVTGAASGIGLEVLKILLTYDCNILAVDLNGNRIKEKSKKLIKHSCDLSKKREVDTLFTLAKKKLGTIDIFIANAGFAYFEKIGKADWAHIERIYQVNTISPIYSAEKMKEQSGDRPYRVLATASAMGYLPLPGYALYSSTKAAVKGFAEAYRFELPENGRFQVVYPIATRTNFFHEAGDSPVPFPSQTAETVAKAMVKGIQKDKNSIFPSRLFRTVWILNRIFPFILALELKIESWKFKKWLKSKDEKK